jgi:hypothetical protein
MNVQSFQFDNLPEEFIVAIDTLKKGREMENEGKKLVETCKQYFEIFLQQSRKCDLDSLKIGDMVLINKKTDDGLKLVLKIAISAQKRFDQDSFKLANMETYNKFVKPFPVKNFEV